MQNAPGASSVTCSSCGQPATVPFTPTPGRPVYCRDCFSKQRAASPGGAPGRPPMRSGGPGGFRSGPARDGRPPPVPGARKRMLAQGRKGHFMFDANEILKRVEGGMDDQHHRAFLEGLFARGARQDVNAAQDFLDEKLQEGVISPDERDALGRLMERYSFWR